MNWKQNKVVLISITKIESDILESFVRHSLTFSDEILLVDNGSADGTPEILRKMCDEGLPVTVRHIQTVEFAHAEIMNQLLEEAVFRHHADIVLPLDIDEFLLCDEGSEACCKLVHSLDPGKAYRLRWRKYAPCVPYMPSMGFLLSQECYREANWREDSKAAVGAGLFQRGTARLIQGCHHVYWESPSGARMVEEMELPQVHIAHFHWRSAERYRTKIMVGQLGTIAKYSAHTISVAYTEDTHKRIVNGQDYTLEDIFDHPAERFSPSGYCQRQELKYVEDVHLDPLAIVLQDSVRLADAYVEMKVLQKQRHVDIILPCWGDMEALKKSLDCAQSQTYPYKTLYICDMRDGRSACKELEATELQRRGQVVFLEAHKDCSVFQRLAEETSGDYVQWLFPGSWVPVGHIQKLVTCIESQDIEFSMVMWNWGPGKEEMTVYTDLCNGKSYEGYHCQALWKHLLAIGRYPTNGLDGILVRRQAMQQAHWFQDCITGHGCSAMHLWIDLLQPTLPNGQGMILGAFRENSVPPRSCSANEYIRHQLQWLRLLVANQDALSDENLREAMGNLMDNSRTVARHAREASAELLEEYMKMLSDLAVGFHCTEQYFYSIDS